MKILLIALLCLGGALSSYSDAEDSEMLRGDFEGSLGHPPPPYSCLDVLPADSDRFPPPYVLPLDPPPRYDSGDDSWTSSSFDSLYSMPAESAFLSFASQVVYTVCFLLSGLIAGAIIFGIFKFLFPSKPIVARDRPSWLQS